MAHKHVEREVLARLEAEWTRSADCPVFTENTKADAPDGGEAFIILQFPSSSDRRIALGTRHHVQEGAFRMVLHLPTGIGTETAQDWGEELCAIFRGVKFAGIQTVAPQAPSMNETGEGPYVWVSIAVPFWYSYAG